MKNGKDVVVSDPGAQNQTPADMIRLAVSSGADLEKLEKLLTLQERWEANEARKAYNEAMSAFKANAPKIVKDKKVGYEAKTGGKVGYKHASLYQVAEKIAVEMSKHGLSASWRVAQNGAVSVTTRVVHSKGHFEETTLTAPPDNTGNKNSIQQIGSTISYLQRYGLLCIAGLATADMDDDAQSAVTDFISEKELSQLLDLIADKEVNHEKFLKYMEIESLEKMPRAKYEKALFAIQQKSRGVK